MPNDPISQSPRYRRLRAATTRLSKVKDPGAIARRNKMLQDFLTFARDVAPSASALFERLDDSDTRPGFNEDECLKVMRLLGADDPRGITVYPRGLSASYEPGSSPAAVESISWCAASVPHSGITLRLADFSNEVSLFLGDFTRWGLAEWNDDLGLKLAIDSLLSQYEAVLNTAEKMLEPAGKTKS